MSTEESNASEIPWPILGDKLFGSGTDWRYDACFNFMPNGWNLYATGYKEAADIIVERVVATRDGMDTLIYPVVFLYRHYLELRLKEIIIEGQKLTNASDDLKLNHNIKNLWTTARKLLEQIWPDGHKAVLHIVEDCINEFHEIDRDSRNFRYPEEKDGKRALPNLKSINFPKLAEVMRRIASFLDPASGGISAHLDEKQSCANQS